MTPEPERPDSQEQRLHEVLEGYLQALEGNKPGPGAMGGMVGGSLGALTGITLGHARLRRGQATAEERESVGP